MKNLISYHGSHSGEFCDHAQAGVTLQQIVEERISKGFVCFGLTEHMPRDREAFLYPEEVVARRTPEILRVVFDNYVAEAKRLQQVAAKQGVHILVGFETEYCAEDYPAYINRLREESGVDYIVGSIHHVHGIPFDFNQAYYAKAVERCGGLEQLYVQYYEQQLDLIEQCRPEVIGHFDLIKIFAPKKGMTGLEISPPISRQINRNIETVISYGGVFEVNSRAFAKGLAAPYPGMDILRRIRTMGGEITLGDDSHGIDDIGKDYGQVVNFLRKVGFKQIIAFRKRDTFNKDRGKPMAGFEKIGVDL